MNFSLSFSRSDLHCFYLRGERSPLLDEMLAAVRAFRRAAERDGAVSALAPDRT